MRDYSPLVHTTSRPCSAVRTVAALIVYLVLEVVTSRELSPRTSTTLLTLDGDQRRLPVAVLKSNLPDGSATSAPDVRIFAEDPRWESKVEDFVLAAGVTGDGVSKALDGVRDVAWAAGSTLRAKYMVLLASAEDINSDDGDGPPCRLTHVVEAASRHTSDAHFILVANGFKLATEMREIIEHSLRNGGWIDFTVIELPEFEGFASAFNRAMGNIATLGNPVVAALSTSTLLVNTNAADIPVSTGTITTEASFFASSKMDAELEEEFAHGSRGGRADDLFVAYERLHTSTSYTSSIPASRDDKSGVRDQAEYSRGGSGGCSGLLVTAARPPLAARGVDGGPIDATSTGSAEAGPRGNAQSTPRPLSSAAPIKHTALSLSDIAPIPLLVFDSKTFSALGELDEGFFFQGGVADWIHRARSWREGGHTTPGVESTYSSCAHGEPPTLHDSNGGVRHVHEQGWAKRFLRAWTATRGEQPQLSDLDVAAMGQWGRLPAARLQALVQADADLFFLPFVLREDLSTGNSGSATAAAAAAARCVEFHANWMERGPDNFLVEGAFVRGEKFPVAAVVVVHDDISLMRATLEEVARVVEYILVLVSVTPWRGSTRDISPTLELLETLRGDANSPTHGKMQIELGNWSSEEEQREHGNSLVKADLRDFARILVVDTDEFWHPVELTKTLILAARHPRAAYFRAEMATYWASLRSVVTPPELLHVLWLVDPHRCRWFRNREIECTVDADNAHPGLDISNTVAVVHHLSYVRTEEGLRRKMETFSHAGEEKDEWYRRSWLGWAANHTLNDLHPTVPEAFKSVRPQPLFELTPSLRTLYLDARKGRSIDTRTDTTTTARAPTSSVNKSEHDAIPGSNVDGITRGASEGGDNLYDERGGCQGTPQGTWTELQRMLCLIPDVDVGAARSLRRGRPVASIGRTKDAHEDYDQAPEAAANVETREYQDADIMDIPTPTVESAAKEEVLAERTNRLRVEILRPTLGAVFREEETLLEFSVSGEWKEGCIACWQIRGLASGSHVITINVVISPEAIPIEQEGSSVNKITRNQHASARVLASDTVIIDVVGPGWHGEAEIEGRTYEARGLAGHVRGVSSNDVGGSLLNLLDDPGGDTDRQMIGVDKIEGVLRVAIVSGTLEGDSQNIAFEKLCHGLPRSRYDVEWFTAQAPAAASLEPLWTRLAFSLVPVRAVSIPSDPARAMGILNDIEIETLYSYHPINCTGDQAVGDEGPRGGQGMSLAEYVAELSNFDVVLSANSLELVETKVLAVGAYLARRPIRVVALCNVAPPRDLYAEAFLAPSAYAASHPTVSILQLPTAIIYPAALKPDCWQREETGHTERRSARHRGGGRDSTKDTAGKGDQLQPTIRIGFVGRLSTARSPGLFLHAAKHLLTSLSSSGTTPTEDLSQGDEVTSSVASSTGSDVINATVAARTANAPVGFFGAPAACSGASRVCTEATESSPNLGAAARLHDNTTAASTALATVLVASAAVADRITFVMAGSGPLADHLGALAQELGLSDRVEFVGAVKGSDMPAFLRSLDIVINPAVCETFGIANAEASAVGIPTVGFESCGVLESTSADRDLAAWPPSALGLAQSATRLLVARGYLGSTGNATTDDAGSGTPSTLDNKEEVRRDFTLETFIKRHDAFLTTMVRRKRRTTQQDASEKGITTNARFKRSSDNNETFIPLDSPLKNLARARRTADHVGREGDMGIAKPADVSNRRVLASGASPGVAGSDTGVPSRTGRRVGGIGTIVVGFSPGTAYLEAFLRRVFTKVFCWVDKVEVVLDPDPDLAPAVYVVGALDGRCGDSWGKRCRDRTTALAERYQDALVVFVNGESSDVSALTLHQASAALLTTTSPGKRPREVPSFHLPNLVTSFGERRTHSSSDLLQCRRGGGKEMGEMNASEDARNIASVAYMYSRCDRPIRQAFFDLLTDRGVSVDALGACQGHRTPDLPHLRRGRFRSFWHDHAVETYRRYGLVIAFENSDDPGYVTEKLANAFLSGAVPVYWGTADASQVFNPESFIHCGEFITLEACADRVAEVAGNESLWDEYRAQPCVRHDQKILGEWLSVWGLDERPAGVTRGGVFRKVAGLKIGFCTP